MSGTSGLDFKTVGAELTYWLGHVGQAFKGGFAGSGENGYDFSMPEGTPVYAILPGKVVGVGVYGGGGVVSVQYTPSTIIYYQHLLVNQAQVGETIGAGEQIGLSGGLHKPSGGGSGAGPVTCCSNFSHVEVGINAPFGGFWNPNNVTPNTNPIGLFNTLLATYKQKDAPTSAPSVNANPNLNFAGLSFNTNSSNGSGSPSLVSITLQSLGFPPPIITWIQQPMRIIKAWFGIMCLGAAALLVILANPATGTATEITGVATGDPVLTAIGGATSNATNRRGRQTGVTVVQQARPRNPPIITPPPPAPPAPGAVARPGAGARARGGPPPGGAGPVPPVPPVPPAPGPGPAPGGPGGIGPIPPVVPPVPPAPAVPPVVAPGIGGKSPPKTAQVVTPPPVVPPAATAPPAKKTRTKKQSAPVPVVTATPAPTTGKPLTVAQAMPLDTPEARKNYKWLQRQEKGPPYQEGVPYNLIANKPSPLPGAIGPRKPFVAPTQGMPPRQPPVTPPTSVQRGPITGRLNKQKQTGFVFNPPPEPTTPTLGGGRRQPPTREQVLQTRLRRDRAFRELGITESDMRALEVQRQGLAASAADKAKRREDIALDDLTRQIGWGGGPPKAEKAPGTGPATLEEERAELRTLQSILTVYESTGQTEHTADIQRDIVRALARIEKLEQAGG